MKTTTFLSLMLSLLFLSFSITTTKTIQGQVLEKDKTPLIGANIIVTGTTIGTITDIDGKYFLEEVPEDATSISISYTGYGTKEIEISESFQEIILEESAILDEIVITEYKTPLVSYDLTTSSTITAKSRKKREAVAEGFSLGKNKDAAMNFMAFGDTDKILIKEEVELPGHGLLTAAEWNDLNNWADWNDLLSEDNYKEMESYWQIFPRKRYSVFATISENQPAINCNVNLINTQGEIIWTSLTDNSGKAELWNGFNDDESDVSKIVITQGKKSLTIKDPKSSEEGMNEVRLNMDCQSLKTADIMFVVDATGSMGDEINYLRSELSDVVKSVKENNDDDFEYRIGSVFYKDKKDDYITAHSPLDADITKTVNFIESKSAGGGGDYPEAVDDALALALEQDWNPDAISRIIFLLLDAPPHHNTAVLNRLQNQIKDAASRGIKIIPITASGIDRNTEFLMKFFAISTNGTYVFITDDSGIGNPHLAPVVEDYEVEKLNALLIRLISNYSKLTHCGEVTLDPPKSPELNANIYPNPASQFVKVELDKKVDQIVLRSASGKRILQILDTQKGINRINLDNLVPGMYTISIIDKEAVVVTKQLIIVS